jgi:Na+/H+ antiporter NhaC
MNNARMTRALIIAVATILIVTGVPATLAIMTGVIWAGGVLIVIGTLSSAGLISTTINGNTENPS